MVYVDAGGDEVALQLAEAVPAKKTDSTPNVEPRSGGTGTLARALLCQNHPTAVDGSGDASAEAIRLRAAKEENRTGKSARATALELKPRW